MAKMYNLAAQGPHRVPLSCLTCGLVKSMAYDRELINILKHNEFRMRLFFGRVASYSNYFSRDDLTWLRDWLLFLSTKS